MSFLYWYSLVFDEGRLVETGTYASLLAIGGIYTNLAALQFCGGKKGGQAPARDAPG